MKNWMRALSGAIVGLSFSNDERSGNCGSA